MDDHQIPGASLPYARLQPQFGQLCAVLGWYIKTTQHWIPFERLVTQNGWKRVLRAAEKCEPGHRFPSDIEKWCREFAKQDAEAQREAAKERPKEKVRTKGRLVKVDGAWKVEALDA